MNITTTGLPSGCVMTLKDVVDTINKERGVKPKEKGFIQHGIAKKIIEEMAENSTFGTVKEFLTVNYDKNGKIQGNSETLALTKKQAIASGARLKHKGLK